jgi:TolB-like protein
VVLPFANLGGDPEQEYFVDGVTESLTTDLSRISGALVIACNTAFTFKGKAIDVKKLGRELNVRYVLEGSMQRGGNRLRVNVQLIDAGKHLWAERFDKPVTDLLDMQDEIVSRLANTLDAPLIAAEARRAERSLHPDALDLVFQGRSWFNKGLIPDYMARARGFFEKAMALDPENVEAMVGLARVDAMTGAALMTDEWLARLTSAEATLTKALSLAPNHAVAHMLLGLVQMFTKRAAQAIAQCEHALALDRNLAPPHAVIGGTPPFSSRHFCPSMDGNGRLRQGAARCRCRSSRLATPGHRRKPKLFPRTFCSCGYAGVAWRAGRSTDRSANGTGARSEFHHSPLPCH